MGRQIEIPSIYMDKENTGHIGLTCERGFCVVQEMALWEYTGEGDTYHAATMESTYIWTKAYVLPLMIQAGSTWRIDRKSVV